MRSTRVVGIPLYHVDAFSKRPFAGNPAAVCLLEETLEDSVLQSIAAEMNLSETAFLLAINKKSMIRERFFSLRWFTPKTEVDLCGHATLATAAVLFDAVGISTTEIEFETRSGILTATREENGILLNLPSYMTTRVDPDDELLEAAGITDFKSVYSSGKSRDLLVLMKNEKAVRNLKPDFDRLRSLRMPEKVEGIIVTAKGHAPYDFVSRCFAPWVGINEDPVTGAAHAVLAPFWSEILKKKEMHAFQASERGGELEVKILSPHRVGLIGNAVIVSKGELRLR
jgi:PhzF family phenazine biosynthesis protein